jgi:cytochrome c-type biogenesis protein CcmH
MPLFWFLTGALSSLAALAVLYPWLRDRSRLRILLGHRATAPLAAALLIVSILAAYHGLSDSRPPALAAAVQTDGFKSAAKTFADASGDSADLLSAAPKVASPMQGAIANLEGRLSKGGGSPDDWELLAKSFEFLGRPADAAAARAHQLPEPAAGAGAATVTDRVGTAISGEVRIAPALSAKAAVGDTLFIVAKSINSPGPPVAVFRGAVGAWPVQFTLNDSQSMLAGRNLSNAGRVIVEARISLKGQPLPASGDLQGASGEIDPKVKLPLKILIDRVIP